MDGNATHLTNIYELFTCKQLITVPTRVSASSSAITYHIEIMLGPRDFPGFTRENLSDISEGTEGAVKKRRSNYITHESCWRLVRSW